jgi:hypothetical protein
MNEAFERQFCSGCLGLQITTKIEFTNKKCCSEYFDFLYCHIFYNVNY